MGGRNKPIDNMPSDEYIRNVIATDSNTNKTLRGSLVRGQSYPNIITRNDFEDMKGNVKDINKIIPVPIIANANDLSSGKIYIELYDSSINESYIPEKYQIECCVVEALTSTPYVTHVLPYNSKVLYSNFHKTGYHYLYIRTTVGNSNGRWSEPYALNITSTITNNTNNMTAHINNINSASTNPQITFGNFDSSVSTSFHVDIYKDMELIYSTSDVNTDGISITIPPNVLDHDTEYSMWYRGDTTDNGVVYGEWQSTSFRTGGISNISSSITLPDLHEKVVCSPIGGSKVLIVTDIDKTEDLNGTGRAYIVDTSTNKPILENYTSNISQGNNDIGDIIRNRGTTYMVDSTGSTMLHGYKNSIITMNELRSQHTGITTDSDNIQLVDLGSDFIMMIVENTTDPNDHREEWYKPDYVYDSWSIINDIPLKYYGCKYVADNDGVLYKIGGKDSTTDEYSRVVSTSDITSLRYDGPSYRVMNDTDKISATVDKNNRIIMSEYTEILYDSNINGLDDFKNHGDLTITAYDFVNGKVSIIYSTLTSAPHESQFSNMCVTGDGRLVTAMIENRDNNDGFGTVSIKIFDI